jgi:hypothetical protein
VLSAGVCHGASLLSSWPGPMSEAAGDDGDLEPAPFIVMRAEETFDGQERVMSRAAYDLQVRATVHSASCGHPGYVPDDYLEHLDGLGMETTDHRGRAVRYRHVATRRGRLPRPGLGSRRICPRRCTPAHRRGPQMLWPPTGTMEPEPGHTWPRRWWSRRPARYAAPRQPASSS